MAITRIRGLQQVTSGSITPTELSQSIAGQGLVLGSTGSFVSGSGLSLDTGFSPSFPTIDLHGINQQNTIEGFVLISGSTTRTLADGTNANMGLIVENDISASTVHSDFLIVSESVNVGSGSSIWGGDLNDTHEFTGSMVITSGSGLTLQGGNLTVDGNVTAEKFIVKSSVIEQTILAQSGSTAFGDTLDDTHSFTGSVDITGSLEINQGFTQAGDVIPNAESIQVLNIPTGSMTIGTGSLTVTDVNIGGAVGSDSLNAAGTISASKLHAGTSGAIGLDIEGGAVIGEDLTVLGSTYVSGTIKMAGGDLQLGDGGGDNIILTGEISSSIIPDAHHTYDLGSTSQAWDDLYVRNVSSSDGTFTELSIDNIDGIVSKELYAQANISRSLASSTTTTIAFTNDVGAIQEYTAKAHLAGTFSGSFSGSFTGEVPAESVTGLNLSEIKDTDGDAFVKTERDTDEDKIIMSAPSNVSVTGSIYASGSDGSSINIGKAEGANYNNGLYTDLTDATSVGIAIDRFNTVLKSLAPAQTPVLMNTTDKQRVWISDLATGYTGNDTGVWDVSGITTSFKDGFGTSFRVGFDDNTSNGDYTGITTANGASSTIAFKGSYTATAASNQDGSSDAEYLRGYHDGDGSTMYFHFNHNQSADAANTNVNYPESAFDYTNVTDFTIKVFYNNTTTEALKLEFHNLDAGSSTNQKDGAIDIGATDDPNGVTRNANGPTLSCSAPVSAKFTGTGDTFDSFKHRHSLVVSLAETYERKGFNFLYMEIVHNGTTYTSKKYEWINFDGDAGVFDLTTTANSGTPYSLDGSTVSNLTNDNVNSGGGMVSGIKYGYEKQFNFDNSDNSAKVHGYFHLLYKDADNISDIRHSGTNYDNKDSNISDAAISTSGSDFVVPSISGGGIKSTTLTSGAQGFKELGSIDWYAKDSLGLKDSSSPHRNNWTPTVTKLLLQEVSLTSNTDTHHYFENEIKRCTNAEFKGVNDLGGDTVAQRYSAITALGNGSGNGNWDSAKSIKTDSGFDDGMLYCGGAAWFPTAIDINGITSTNFSNTSNYEWPTQNANTNYSTGMGTGNRTAVMLFKKTAAGNATKADLKVTAKTSGGSTLGSSNWKTVSNIGSLSGDELCIELVNIQTAQNVMTGKLDTAATFGSQTHLLDADGCKSTGESLDFSGTAIQMQLNSAYNHGFTQNSYVMVRITVSDSFTGYIEEVSLDGYTS